MMPTNKKKTQEEYVNELRIKNPTVEVIGMYVDARTKIKHHCLIHDIYWDIAPTNALKGNGCSECHKERIGKRKQKTHEQYIEEVRGVNPNIIVVEKYVNAKTPILHKCAIHNVEWKPYPEVILRGGGCPECWKEKLHDIHCRTHEQYVIELALANPNVIVLGTYVDALTPILHKCLIDGYEWHTIPNSLLQGCGCPKCAGNLQLSAQEYVERLYNINPNIVPLEDYKTAKTKIWHKCLIDGYKWMVEPSSTLQGYGCPKCCESKGEKVVAQWLDKNNIQYISQKKFDDCKDKYSLPFDFYLPEFNCCVEYDGRQHFEAIDWFGGQESLEYTQRHDRIKTEYCQNNNIQLLRIAYFEDTEEKLNNFLFI